MVGREDVDAEDAVFLKRQIGARGSVEANEKRRGTVGNAADCGGGKSGTATRSIRGDDMNGGAEARHRVSKVHPCVNDFWINVERRGRCIHGHGYLKTFSSSVQMKSNPA